MKKFLMAVAALACMGGVALAGPNAGGTIFAADQNLVYTVDTPSYCGLGTQPATCEGADLQIDGANDPSLAGVLGVFAAFPTNSSPRLKGMAFGVHYGANVRVVAYGACIGDLNNGAAEFPGPGWPASDTGTAIVFQNTQTAHIVQAYWFAGYAYYGNADQFCLRDNPDPGLGGAFGDDSVPALIDPIAGYGCLGFNMPGAPACPSVSTGACCIGEQCTITTEADCAGRWLGANVPCDPNPCLSTGACCIGGVCSITTQPDCAGQWMGPGTVCDPNPCTQTGACCVDQTCTIETQADCESHGGVYRGDNIPCDPNPCVVPVHESTWGQIKNNYR